ncbi:MAG: ComEC/Rec2 family competence protein, partial [Bacteroidia bacterium]
MRIWNQVPLFRILLPFIAGILVEIFYPLPVKLFICLLASFITVVSLFTFFKFLKRSRRLNWINGVSINAAFFSLGVIITYLNTDSNLKNNFSRFPQATAFVASLDDQLHEKRSTYKSVLNILSIKDENGEWEPVRGKVVAYFKQDSLAAKLKYGDLIFFKSVPQATQPPKNPEEFDYKQFLSFHNIYHQLYLAGGKWIPLDDNDGNFIIRYAFDLRDRLVNIFKKYIPQKREYAVASALVLGYEDSIDAELINAYASAGALHVLSVSGMHVAIIYFVLSGLLVWLERNKLTRHFKFIILLLFLWFYAMLTGFSPSVLRSAVMLSIIIIGNWSFGNTNIFNTLIVSVFVLLVYNPYLITEVGFQLSYLAVFGIVYLHPMIVRQLEFSSLLTHKIWEITSVSISAQIMTFPLGLLYFHQFPNLFFVSNLVVIPLATVIIYLCIFLLFVSSLQYAAFYLSKVCYGLLFVLNKSVLIVEEIPLSIAKGISISVFETWIIYLLMAMILLFILFKRPRYLQLSFLVFIVLLSGQLYERYKLNTQKKFIVYSIPKESAFDFIDGKNNYYLSSEQLYDDKSKMMFHVIHNWWALG